MEAKLEKKSVSFYKNLFSADVTQEETMEMIVPDAMPDIVRIIETDGVITLRSKEAEAGRATVGGVINAVVLYMPEGDEQVKKLELKIPFTSVLEHPAADSSVRLTAKAVLCSIDSRNLNPRKILVRADVCTQISGYGPVKLELCHAVEEAPQDMEILLERRTVKSVADVREKTFVISDDYVLPSSAMPAGEILASRIALLTEDTRTVGSKLIIKGNAMVSVLYRSRNEGELCKAEFSTVFSQIAEIEAVSNPEFAVTIMPTGIYFDLADGSGGNLMITMELHAVAQIVVIENREIEYISDMYSTAYDLICRNEKYSIDTVESSTVIREDVRKNIETYVQAKSIVCVNAFTGKTSKINSDDGCRFETTACVEVVYKSEDGRLFSVRDKMNVSAMWEDPCENVACVCSADCGDASAVIIDEGIEVRMSVDFIVTALKSQTIDAITGAGCDDTALRDISRLPSVTLRRVANGDTLWMLAKRYNSTRALILEANGMEEMTEQDEGRLLIIPKRR